MKNQTLKNLVLTAMFLAIGLVLPFFTGQIKQIGNMLLPMHLPVLLCGLSCGPLYGTVIGVTLPLLRSALFSRPVLYPNAVAMALELGTYGLTIGLFYLFFSKRTKLAAYPASLFSLLIAMLTGRIVWGLAQTLLLLGNAKPFTLTLFLTNGFLHAIPGIILQILLIPTLMLILTKSRMTRNYHLYS